MPFTQEQFFQVFREYNDAIFPMQAFLYLLAIAAIAAALLRKRGVATMVALLWVWCGVEYHWRHFARVNDAAFIFGLLFLIGAVMLLKPSNLFRSPDVPPLRASIGLAIVSYALLAYPVVGYFIRHIYPAIPTFGTPCPLTIFTIGLILMTTRPLPLGAIAVPLLWSCIATTAIFKFRMLEDLGLPIAAATLTGFLVSERLAHVKPLPVSWVRRITTHL